MGISWKLILLAVGVLVCVFFYFWIIHWLMKGYQYDE
jgi:uncharacterized membrane protein YcjF (UPF0283 family)